MPRGPLQFHQGLAKIEDMRFDVEIDPVEPLVRPGDSIVVKHTLQHRQRIIPVFRQDVFLGMQAR